MIKSVLVLTAVLLVGVWMIGCGDDGPADPGGGGGGTANRAPATPTIDTGAGAPADGSTDKALSSTLHWQCSDPDGDDLTFDVYFGQSDPPSSANTGQTAESYDPGALAYSTTYYWKIVAEDPDGLTASSAVWDFTTMAQGAETVSAPTHISRQKSVVTPDTDIWYSAGGSISSFGHDCEYRFDWDDGSFSEWGAVPGEWTYHSWSDYGSYDVKAQGRCIADTLVVSDWASYGNDLVVRESITVPSRPTGPGSGVVGETLTYTVGGSTSSDGHALEYRLSVYIMGQTTYTDWSPPGDIDYVFTRTGQHQVRAQARCSIHTDTRSNVGNFLYVTITDP